MKENILKKLAAAGLAAALTMGLAACGSSAEKAVSSSANYSYAGGSSGWSESVNASYDGLAAEEASAADYDTGSGSGSAGNMLTQNRKIIYTADLDLETTEFEKTVADLRQALSRAGGYIESSSQSGSAENGNRYVSFTFRVPTEQYTAFLSAAEGSGNLTWKSEGTSDVTSQYVDVEARLESLENQRARLEALEEKAETLEDLIAIEDKLTEVQYQIESYTSQKKMLDDQVDSSTVSVSVSEVTVYTPAETSFASRLESAFGESWESFVGGLQQLVILLVLLLPWLVLIGLAVFILRGLVRALKKHRAARLRKKQEKAEAARPQEKKEDPQ